MYEFHSYLYQFYLINRFRKENQVLNKNKETFATKKDYFLITNVIEMEKIKHNFIN